MNLTLLSRLKFASELTHTNSLNDSGRISDTTSFLEQVEQLANKLQQISATRVAFQAENSTDWLTMDLACQVADIVCIPIPSFFSHEQARHCLVSLSVDVVFSDKTTFIEVVGETGEVSQTLHWPTLTPFHGWQLSGNTKKKPVIPEGTQKVTFTSGSTGTPKGVCLSQNNQWKVAESVAEALSLKGQKHLCLLPLATLLENVAGVYNTLLCGGTVIIPSDKERGMSGSSKLDIPAYLDCISRYQPNTLILIPQLLTVLIDACVKGWQPPSSLSFIAVGGGKVAPQMIYQSRRLGLPVFEGYGLSECGSVVSLNTKRQDKPGYVGQPLSHCEVTIVEQEICVRNTSFLGYANDPESWNQTMIRTGDYGEIENGFISIKGRKKNLLITSFGRNINPEWVESELTAQPLLSHCVVIGDQQPYLAALVGAEDSVTDQAIETWISKVNQKLPDYAKVKRWSRISDTDWSKVLTANGRPRRQIIRQELPRIYESLFDTQATMMEMAN